MFLQKPFWWKWEQGKHTGNDYADVEQGRKYSRDMRPMFKTAWKNEGRETH